MQGGAGNRFCYHEGLVIDNADDRRIVMPILPRRYPMAIMCSMQACMANAGMCSHEKMMLGIAALAVIGAGAYSCSFDETSLVVSDESLNGGSA